MALKFVGELEEEKNLYEEESIAWMKKCIKIMQENIELKICLYQLINKKIKNKK